jgi:3-oxoadipate enol-lactonase
VTLSSISYEGRGVAGPPVLLVHGYPLDRSMWQGQLDGLGAQARMVAVDLPGFGNTPPTGNGQTPMTMEELAEVVVATATGLGFAQFVLAGHSMGGYIALAVARLFPDRLCGLVLSNTRAEADAADARRARVADADRVLNEGVHFLVERMLRNLLSPETLATRRDLAVGVETMMRRAHPAGIAAALRGMALRPDVRPMLPHIQVPTLVIAGTDDVITPPAMAQALAAAIPNADMAVIPHAGHLAPFERPDQVNTALRRFIRKATHGPTPVSRKPLRTAPDGPHAATQSRPRSRGPGVAR